MQLGVFGVSFLQIQHARLGFGFLLGSRINVFIHALAFEADFLINGGQRLAFELGNFAVDRAGLSGEFLAFFFHALTIGVALFKIEALDLQCFVSIAFAVQRFAADCELDLVFLDLVLNILDFTLAHGGFGFHRIARRLAVDFAGVQVVHDAEEDGHEAQQHDR